MEEESAASFFHTSEDDPSSSSICSSASSSSCPSSSSGAYEWGTWPWICEHVHLVLAFSETAFLLLKEALGLSWVAICAWSRLGIVLSRPVLRLLFYLWSLALPYMQWFARTFFNHLKEQEPEVLIGYACFLGALIGFLLIRRLLRRLRVWDRCRAFVTRKVVMVEYRYHQARNKLHAYSQRAAEALPHVLFALGSVGAVWLFPKATHMLSQELVFHILLLYLPALATFYAVECSPFPPSPPSTATATSLRSKQGKPPSYPSSSTPATTPPWQEQTKHTKRLNEWLSYWIMTSLVLTFGNLLEQLYLRWFTRLLPFSNEAFLFFLLWLHLPQGGHALLKQHLLPFLRRHLGGILYFQKKRDSFMKHVLSVAVFTRLLSTATADLLALHVDEMFLVLPAAVLSLSPLAGWGLLFISLIFPGFASIRALGSSGGNGISKGGVHYSPIPWLKYWVVYAVSHILFQLMPFWSVIQMWFYLWILLPFELEGVPVLHKLKFDGRRRIWGVLRSVYRQEVMIIGGAGAGAGKVAAAGKMAGARGEAGGGESREGPQQEMQQPEGGDEEKSIHPPVSSTSSSFASEKSNTELKRRSGGGRKEMGVLRREEEEMEGEEGEGEVKGEVLGGGGGR
ncbi:hypothetical protein VYU27_003371 [Nannochloropsis oceanica]